MARGGDWESAKGSGWHWPSQRSVNPVLTVLIQTPSFPKSYLRGDILVKILILQQRWASACYTFELFVYILKQGNIDLRMTQLEESLRQRS
jgi:hypothetical protein